MRNYIQPAKLVLFAVMQSLLILNTAWADDTEVFFGGAATSTNSNPNILFVFDTSGSMSSTQSFTELDANGNPVTVRQSRIGILQDVMSEVLSSQTGVNMGLARFSVPGGPILYPVTDPDEPADPIVLRSLSDANDDAAQSGNKVTLDDDYLNPKLIAKNGIVAFRFKDVDVPQGAIINKATLLFSTDSDSPDLTTAFEIYAEIVPSAAAFTATNDNLSSRISGKSVTWNPGAWDAEPIVDPANDPPTTFESDDLSSVIQQVVNLKGATLSDPAGWCGGNDLVILLKKLDNTSRSIIAYDKSPDFSTKLRIDFDANIPTGEFGCYANTIVSQVSDRYEDSESGIGGSRSTDLDFYKDTYYKDNNKSVALSFIDVAVPQGARVTSATLNFVARSSSSGAAKTVIHAVNSASPPIDNTVHSLPDSKLTSGVVWDIESWAYGVPYSSVDISSVVNSVVNLAGWTETSNMSFLLKGSSGTRAAYSYDGSRSRSPILEVTYTGKYKASAATKRDAMIATVEDFKATGNTPISDTIAEAGLYFKGESVLYGRERGNPTKRDNRISHIDSVTSGLISRPAGCSESNPSATICKSEAYIGSADYKTPIKDACQANHIILLTDGAPTSHDKRTNSIYETWTKELTGKTGTCKTNDSGKDCTIQMAGLFKNNDVLLATLEKEKITTHTIGFYSDQEFLQSVANAGGGKYVTAFSKQDLFNAINEIVDSILDVNTTFVSAGVTVNQYNRLTHNDELYFSLFTPSSETVWPGNLKRYKLLDGDIVDVNSVDAINLNGEFDEASKSWWSAGVDGNDVSKGGVAEFLTNNRLVFTDIASNDLSTITNRVNKDNTAITAAMVSATSSSDREKILRWVVGENVNDTKNPTLARQKLGDPLHSQPTLLIYKTGTSTYRSSVYVGTNEGFLHSFDSVTGTENWSYIPQELLSRLSEVQKDTIGAHSYGLDGTVTLYIENDDVEPGVVNTGERAILYIGMRRGGSTYFALDVTDYAKPKLLFRIDPSVTGYSDLGQSWSKPVIKKMKITGHETVMIFGGGYSIVQDEAATLSKTDVIGKNIYIADAFTGKLLWNIADAVDASGVTGSSAGSLSSINSVPNEVTAFDLDSDDYIDHFYATDTKAQVFRFDINYDTAKITGGRVAHMQNFLTAEENRRFYNSPDISLIRADDTFISIAIGSGYRAHPLDTTVTDHFFMIKDKGVLDGVFDMDANTSDLVDVTNLVGDADTDGFSDAGALINSKTSPKKGWYISFANKGEKVISDSITFNNAVIFTTYTPPGSLTVNCNAIAGTSQLYGMNVVDGNPFVDTNFDGLLTAVDRSAVLTTSGIAPQPQVLFEETSTGVKPRLCVGNQCSMEAFLPKIPESIMGIKWKHN